VGSKDLFERIIGKESFHESGNWNGALSFGPAKNITVKSAIFLNYIIHKCTWSYPDRTPHMQVDQILIDRNLSILG
jgi:hypothetical protein